MKQARYLLEALLLSIVMIISKILPTPWASNLGGFLGRTIGPKLAASRKALNNITKAFPDKTDEEVQRIIRGMWDNLGRVMMEYAHLRHIGRDRTEIIGKDILEKYNNTPAIFFSGHLSNWEVCPPAVLLQVGFIINPIYRAPNNPISDYMLNYARTMGGKLRTIPKSKSGTRHIVKTLQENQGIGMLVDQKYNEGIASNFFGRPAMTSPIFVQLAQRFECPLIPLRIERLKGPNFRVTILDPLDIKDKSVETLVDESHALLEEWIKEKPEQWLWLHRRWDSANLKEDKNDA